MIGHQSCPGCTYSGATHLNGCSNDPLQQGPRRQRAAKPLGKFGHHPDPLIDAQAELDRLEGVICEAHGGLVRALDYRAATLEGLAIKADARHCLRRTGFNGPLGYRATF